MGVSALPESYTGFCKFCLHILHDYRADFQTVKKYFRR